MARGIPYNKILRAARNVMQALKDVGQTECCFVGGMAVHLWEIRHKVLDLDILVLRPNSGVGPIQQALVDHKSGDFFLKKPKSKKATFMLLYYSIPNTRYTVKIDLLLPTEPNLEIPKAFRMSHCFSIDGLDVAPLYFLLYHKLLGWEVRVDSPEGWRREKAAKDYRDINYLCRMISDEGIEPLTKGHMGKLYRDNFLSRADKFVERYEGSTRAWFQRIGFKV